MRAVIALIATLAICSLAADLSADFKFTGNLSKAESKFAIRAGANVDLQVISAWTSVSLNADAKQDQSLAEANILAGIAYPGSVAGLLPPFAVLAMAKANADITAEGLNDIQTVAAKLGASAALEGLSLLKVVELDKNDKEVATHLFVGMATGTTLETGNQYVHAWQVDGFVGKAKVKVTYVTSTVAGIIAYGNTPVSPNTLEVIIELSGYEFADAKNNHLRLVMGSGTLGASAKGDALFSKVDGSETSLYIAASGNAKVNGKDSDASVEIKAGAAADLGTTLSAILNSVTAAIGVQAKLSFNVLNVDFKAGVGSSNSPLVYDPALGMGDSAIYDSAASHVVISAILLLVALIAALF